MRISCDILVTGGGAAGIAAAVRSAREGADTVLAEEKSFPGGTAVNCMHRYICGLYPQEPFSGNETLNGGIADEICAALEKLAPQSKPVRMGRARLFPFETEDLIGVLKALSGSEKRLVVFYETKIVSVEAYSGIIRSVSGKMPVGEIRISPRAVIDCSGNGTVIRLSGADYDISPPGERQLSGFCLKITGIKDPGDVLQVGVPYYVSKAADEKKIPGYLRHIKFYSGKSESEGYCLTSVLPGGDPKETGEAVENAVKIHGILKNSISSFRDSAVSAMSFAVAEREGIRMKGDYTLTEDDVLKGRKFADGVVKNAWPIELWSRDNGPVFKYPAEGVFYEIPLRCFKSRNIKNLYCAGRCISASREALGSSRVMGTCISLGEQAGLAAAKELMNS
jgi:hypothetical protein